MVYANDQLVQLPVMDLYDTQIMAMAINAARDMYEKGQLEMKDFLKTYGDFMTPIAADLDWYNREVTGKIRNAVNALYAQGVDPLRNPLGRAMISLVINNMPYGEMAFKRVRAKNAEEYYKNMAILKANDKYDKDFSLYLKEDPNLWTSDSIGVTSPTVFKKVDDIITPVIKDLKPQFDAQLTAKMNDGYDYSTVSRERILDAINHDLDNIIASPSGGYYYKKAYDAAGGDKDKARQILKEWFADRAGDHFTPTREENKYKMDDYRTKNDIKAHAANAATDYRYDILGKYDLDLNGVIDDEERKIAKVALTKGKDNDYQNNIFREADSKSDTNLPSGYELDHANANKINPVKGEITYRQDKETKSWLYEIPANIINESLYSHDSVYDNNLRLKRLANFRGGNLEPEDYKKGSYYFYPNGQLKAKYDRRTKRTRYFISGVLAHSSASGDFFTDENGATRTYELEVTEQFGKYGKNLEK